MFGFFKKKKTLDEYLNGTRRIAINGVLFEIKRIDPTSHLQGINALQKIYDVYKLEKDKQKKMSDGIETINKIKKACREIILAGVVSPKLSAKPDDVGYHVDEILKDMELSRQLAEEILKYTYKKKQRVKLI